MSSNQQLQTVDAYISAAPAASQAKARELRQLIKDIAPQATERLSYGMPYYGYHGRLLYFGAYKTHLGVYVMSAREQLHQELKPYQKSKATLHFKLDQPLPTDLIKKIISLQMALNEGRSTA